MTYKIKLSYPTYDNSKTYQSKCKYPQGFYIVATPIGNLEDITLRALTTLNNADFIVCEDTRVTKKLLTFYCINKPLIVYNDNKNQHDRDNIINLLQQGKTLAYVSDAGMPLISDPGYKLIQDIIKAKIYFTCIPGASACLTALVLSDLPSDKFIFMGFIPRKKNLIHNAIEYIPHNCTAIFYESARRVCKTLEILSDFKSIQKVCIARELTKNFEQVLYGSPKELLHQLEQISLKGEIVLLLHKVLQYTDEDITAILTKELQECTTKVAIQNVTNMTSLPRSKIYQKAIEIKKSND